MKHFIIILSAIAVLIMALPSIAMAYSPRFIPVPNSEITLVTADRRGATGIAVDHARNRLYLSVGEGRYSTNGAVMVFNMATGALLDEIAIGQDCWNVTIDPVKEKLYVANLQGSVTVIDIRNGLNRIIKTLYLGGSPREIAINLARNRAYVVNAPPQKISVIDTVSDSVISTITNVGFSGGIALNPNTERLYVATFNDQISVYDTTNDINQFLGAVTIPEIAGQESSTADVGVNTRTERLFVTSSGSGRPPVIERITMIDIAGDNNQVIGQPLPVGEQGGGGIREIAINEDTERVYVSNVLDRTVAVINAQNDILVIEKSIPVDPGTYRLTINPQTEKIYGTGAGWSFRFAVLADSRNGNCSPNLNSNASFRNCVNIDALQATFENINKFKPDFVFFTGDMAIGRKGSTRVKKELEAWQDIIDEAVEEDYSLEKVLPVFGGHERNTKTCEGNRNFFCDEHTDCTDNNWGNCNYEVSSDAGQPMWKAFSDLFDPKNDHNVPGLECHYFDVSEIPSEGACLDAGADYGSTVYYCDYNDEARFFVLNNDCDPFLNTGENCQETQGEGHEIGPCQQAWLQKLIQDRPINFLFHHEPAYGIGGHNKTPPLTMDRKKTPRNDYVSIIGDHATFIFSGHEHQYSRRSIDPDFAELPVNLETHLALFVVPGGADGPRRALSYKGAKNSGNPDWAPVLHVEWPSGSYDRPIAREDDDAEEGVDGSIYIDSSDLEMMKDRSDIQRAVGLRWEDLMIPRGAEITNAYIWFTADDENIQSESTSVRICADRAQVSEAFSLADNSLSNRVDWGNCISWDNIAPWDPYERSPDTKIDIKTLVKTVVDRADWGGQTDFSRSFMEVKTGSSGAPWKPWEIPLYSLGAEEYCTDVDNDDYWTPYSSATKLEGKPWHFAIVDVLPEPGEVEIRAAVYAVTIDPDEDLVLIDRYPDSGIADRVKCDDTTESSSANVDTSAASFRIASVEESQVSGAVMVKTDPSTEYNLDLDQENKPDRDFPSGLEGLDIANITPGSTIDLNIEFKHTVPEDYHYYDARNWMDIPYNFGDEDNAISLALTDGGIGDNDHEANGAITHLGGLGAQKPVIINDSVKFRPAKKRGKRLKPRKPRFTSDTEGCFPTTDFDLGYDPGFVGKMRYTTRLKNKDQRAFSDILVEVKALENGHILKNADPVPQGLGAQISVPQKGGYRDGLLEKNETVKVAFEFCLRNKRPFRFAVDVIGRPR